MSELLHASESLGEMLNPDGPLRRFPTGIDAIDAIIGGIPRGQITAVASLPGVPVGALFERIVGGLMQPDTGCRCVVMERGSAAGLDSILRVGGSTGDECDIDVLLIDRPDIVESPEAVETLRRFAKGHRCAVVVTSDLRTHGKPDGVRPTRLQVAPDDLLCSASIVLLLHHPERRLPVGRFERVEVIVAKSRLSGNGVAALAWDRQEGRYV